MKAARVRIGLKVLQDALHLPGAAMIVAVGPVEDDFAGGSRYVEMTIADDVLPDCNDDDIPLLTPIIRTVEWDWGLK